ncbi:MAG: ABC transporter permease [Bifidobacterium crudilactis]|uniref:ABC transporter permease n=1 Tax=Bifidobacterium crudilactis TaxID=327277 RepID=UPI003A5C3ECD
MWTTVKTTIKVNLREKSNVFWLFAFPLILSSLFFGMFSGLGGDDIAPQRMAVVQDSNWSKVYGAQSFVDAISGRDGGSNGTGQTLISALPVESVRAAETSVRQHRSDGYLYATDDGKLSMAIADTVAANANNPISTTSSSVTITALHSMIGQFNQSVSIARSMAGTAQQQRSESSTTAGTSSPAGADIDGTTYSYTSDRTLTHFAPDPFARYYYALLGMTCLMAMTFAAVSITLSQANLSPLGARRSIAPLSRWRQLTATFLACWLVSFISLTVAFLYIRFVCGVSAGGREAMAIAAVLISSFVATAGGLLIGVVPRLSQGAKIGLCTSISCIGALFAGLYGQFAMNVSDSISEKAPALHLLNPVKQVSDLFYDLLYYDSYQPFLRTTGIIAIMSALFLGASVALLRRQRYEYL